ncbi:MAG: ABC transporter permease [Acidobacteriaceae bacterium]|nr:ABC transporter permease [Acidobacteriaceae bacterium]
MQFHLDLEVEKLISRGRTRAEVLREVNLGFGGITQIKEECRQARGVEFIEATIQDFRYAIRGLWQSPGFALTAMSTLAFGTAAVATVFTLANTLFFRQLNVDRSDRIVVVQPTREHGRIPGWASYPDYVHFRDSSKTLESLAAAYLTAPLFVAVNGRSQEINGAVVSANFFPLLRIRPAAGRFFRFDEDAVPNRNPVAIISFNFWRDWLDQSNHALGSHLKINGVSFTVIGIVPPGFRSVGIKPDEIYIPTMMASAGYHFCQNSLANDCTVFDMIGRLRDGLGVEQARTEMTTILPPSWIVAKEGENSGVTAYPLRGVLDADETRASRVHFVALLTYVASVLLMICCANLAGLLIARNSARARELAIRASLGAGRLRLVRLLIAESWVLALSGGALGAALSIALTKGLNAMFYSVDVEGHPMYYNFDFEPKVLVAVLAVSLIAGLAFGIAPALQGARRDTAEDLKRQSTAVSADSRAGRWLAGIQAGIAVALVSASGLLLSSDRFIMSGANFDVSHVALMRLRPRLVNHPVENAQRYLRTVIQQLNKAPGVESASMVSPGSVLLGGDARVSLPDWRQAQGITVGYIEVAPRYFETLRTPVLRGREFDDRDTLRSPRVAVVSSTLARQFWPTGAVVGSLIVVNREVRQVVGVVADIPLQSRFEPQQPYVYVPFWQNAAQMDARVCIRVKGDPAAMLPQLVKVANRIDPVVPIAETIPLSVSMAGILSHLRITATFVSYAAALALLLTGIGLYGVLAFSVSRRTKEIGLRLAVGATVPEVFAMLMREGMAAVCIGVAMGLPLAIAASALVRRLLYGPAANDARVYAAAALTIAGIGLLACCVPARRAARLDAAAALKQE